MVDWRRINDEISVLETLQQRDVAQYLDSLHSADSELAETVTRFLSPASQGTFLRTHTPEHIKTITNLRPGTMFGVWRLESLLGKGGMGAVYRAQRADGLYEQTAALKVVQTLLDNQRERFNQERKRLARLNHPGIVRIIDGGVTDDDLAFLVMDYVEGQSLDRWLTEQQASFTELLEIAIDLAETVSHAHSRLILHRDIKPSNILITPEGKTKLLDFGIGTDLNEADTAIGALTFAYAAPEQLNQKTSSVATDIFAFGVTLHQMLTGGVPERSVDGGVEIDDKALRSGELRSILAKALAFDPNERYASIALMREDLVRLTKRQPVEAFSSNRSYQFRKFLLRYPASSGLAGGLVAALIGGLSASLYSLTIADSARVQAEQALERERLSNVSEAAFTDTLLNLFSDQDEDINVTNGMIKHAEGAFLFRQEDPDQAAMTAFAIGRTLTLRWEQAAAIEVLEPWVRAGYGPERLIWQGKVDLGYNYLYSGKREEALQIFRDAKNYFSSVSDSPYYEHVVASQQICETTRAKDDCLSTIELAKEALDTKPEGNELSFYLNTLDMANSRIGDFDQAVHYSRKALDHHLAHPLLSAQRLASNRINLAHYSVFHSRDLNEARELLLANINDPQISEGHNVWSYMLLGQTESQLGDYEKAEDIYLKALEIFQRDHGPKSFGSIATQAGLIENALRSGKTDEATTRLDELTQRFGDRVFENYRLLLVKVHYLIQTDKHAESLNLLRDNHMTPDKTSSSLISGFYVNEFRNMGLNVDSLDAD